MGAVARARGAVGVAMTAPRREWTERRVVPVALTPAEARARARSLGALLREVAALEAAEKERAKAARSVIAKERAKLAALGAVVESGEEPREIAARCVADALRGVLEVYHPDTGELLGTSPLEAAQLALDGSEHPVSISIGEGAAND